MERRMEAIVGVDTSEYDRGMDEVARRADIVSNRMRTAMRAARAAMLPFKVQLQDVRARFMDLGMSMDSYRGTNAQFMNDVRRLGAEYKAATDAMIANNNYLRGSLLMTAGTLMNMTTQATRISENYKRMRNPMYRVNGAGLAVASAMNRIANNGNAAVLALRMLGPTANMKKLRDMQMMITQGLMRFQMVAIGAAVASALLYSNLHKGAMKVDKEYKQLFETMGKNVKKAFEPMVQAFAAVMKPIFKFINAIALMIIKFNEAHPTLAKVIQGIMMLVPILTLILSPLAIGIGLFAGLSAAMGALWPIIGPVVTGMAAMMATVWLVSAALVALTVGITKLWKENETFRTTVITAWEAIKQAAIKAWDYVLNSVLIPTWNAIVSFAKQIWGSLKDFWKQNGDDIKTIAKVVWDFVKTYAINNIKTTVATLKTLWNVLSSVVTSCWDNIKGAISGAVKIISGIIGVFVSVLTGDWSGAWENMKKISQGAWEFLSNAAQIGVDALLGVIRGIGRSIGGEFEKMSDSFYNAGKGFMEQLIKGIGSMVSKVTSKISEVAGQVRDFLPFSPAKTGPLSDLDKLDFGGPIVTSIKKATPMVQNYMPGLVSLPTLGGNTTNNNYAKSGNTFNFYPQKAVIDENDIVRQFQRMEVLYG
ncbi:hypothetical protein V7146_02470 [Gottfriedia acidiceleris]|uniref:phage tail protein n=1 Tax=Gottfriedia acidiceleris TaxID=371036 RepID=UPI002FFF67CC